MKPRRIQRKRAAGWRMPEGAVYVGRPTKWGNPYPLRQYVDVFGNKLHGRDVRKLAVLQYRRHLLDGHLDISTADVRRELRGKDLVCWCPKGASCHADVLLAIANTDKPSSFECWHDTPLGDPPCECPPDPHCEGCCVYTPIGEPKS